MSYDLLAAAERRRDLALAEARRWEAWIEGYRELAGPAKGEAPHSEANAGVPDAQAAAAPRPSTGGGAMQATEAAVTDILADAGGGPMQTRDLLEGVLARGIEVGGKDPVGVLSARLSRSTLVENVRPYGWRLKRDPPEEAKPHPMPAGSQMNEAVGENSVEDAPTASVLDAHEGVPGTTNPDRGPQAAERQVVHEKIDLPF